MSDTTDTAAMAAPSDTADYDRERELRILSALLQRAMETDTDVAGLYLERSDDDLHIVRVDMPAGTSIRLSLELM